MLMAFLPIEFQVILLTYCIYIENILCLGICSPEVLSVYRFRLMEGAAPRLDKTII